MHVRKRVVIVLSVLLMPIPLLARVASEKSVLSPTEEGVEREALATIGSFLARTFLRFHILRTL